MKKLFEQKENGIFKFIIETKNIHVEKNINWVKPNADIEMYELFGRGVQLLHEGEFDGIIDKNLDIPITKASEEIYNELSKYSEFLKYAKGQSKASNCLAGEIFQSAYSKGKISSVGWDDIFSASADDIGFKFMYEKINTKTDLKSRIEIANQLSNITTIKGQTRDLTKMVESMLDGKTFPTPSIYIGNKITFIAGKTRVLSCMALDIVPNIWIVKKKDVLSSIKNKV